MLLSTAVCVCGSRVRAHTPEALRSFTRSTELMTSLPISSKTSTFHIAPPEAASGASLASFWASTSVMGALRFRMRFMLARKSTVSLRAHRGTVGRARVPICLSRSETAAIVTSVGAGFRRSGLYRMCRRAGASRGTACSEASNRNSNSKKMTQSLVCLSDTFTTLR